MALPDLHVSDVAAAITQQGCCHMPQAFPDGLAAQNIPTHHGRATMPNTLWLTSWKLLKAASSATITSAGWAACPFEIGHTSKRAFTADKLEPFQMSGDPLRETRSNLVVNGESYMMI